MKTVIHRANTRGFANHGWLKSNHSFSFASYHNPERMGFGLLRVINDDQVEPSQGFGTHPHQDMEIVSIPLFGALKHKDSEGNETVVRSGEVQIMSAGTGVRHSEYNDSDSEIVHFLQIWVMPENLGIKPRYDQKAFLAADRKNQIQTIVSPIGTSDKGIKINQQAFFSLVDFDAGRELDYMLHQPKNGIYVFVLEGQAKVADETLGPKDAMGVEDFEKLKLVTENGCRILLIEVPMVGSEKGART